MNILILNWKDIKNPQAGGAEVIAFELAKRFSKKGDSVTFFTRGFTNSLPEEIIDGVRVIRRGNRFTVFFHVISYYLQLSSKPDKVIDMINTIGWFTPLYVPKKKRVAYLNQLASEVWFYEFPFPLAMVGYLIERMQYFFYRSTQFLCYSASSKNDLISLGIPKTNISIFPIGIDQKRYYPGTKTKYPFFIFVARLVRMKRADLCIRSIKEVVRSHPDVQLAIIGNGREEKKLMELVHSLSLSKQVKFVNKNNFFFKKNVRDVKVKLMQQAWALLLPSVKEGWGLVVTEAGACGTPSVVSDVTGLRDSVIQEKTGIIVSKNPNTYEMVLAMNRIINDENFRKKIGNSARIYARKFTWENSFRSFSKYIYNL